jgi:hypothetical protein
VKRKNVAGKREAAANNRAATYPVLIFALLVTLFGSAVLLGFSGRKKRAAS